MRVGSEFKVGTHEGGRSGLDGPCQGLPAVDLEVWFNEGLLRVLKAPIQAAKTISRSTTPPGTDSTSPTSSQESSTLQYQSVEALPTGSCEEPKDSEAQTRKCFRGSRHNQVRAFTLEDRMTISLAELLRDSAYKLSQFKPKQIQALEARISMKETGKNPVPYLTCLVRAKPIRVTP